MEIKIDIPESQVIKDGDMVQGRGRFPARTLRVRLNKKTGLFKVGNGRFAAEYADATVLNTYWEKASLSPAASFFRAFVSAQRDRYKDFMQGLCRECIQLAIDANMQFWEDDFCFVSAERKWPFVPANMDDSSLEGFYSHALKPYRGAVCNINMTAVRALEKALNRKPFLLNGERLFVGRSFTWEGATVVCTSITREWRGAPPENHDKHLVACSYKWLRIEQGHGERKVDRVFRITHDDLDKTTQNLKQNENIVGGDTDNDDSK